MTTPDPRQWSEIETLFFDALQVPAAGRAHWIAQAAAGREDLIREVLTLVEAHEASESAAPRRRIGAYLLERRIGRGGMGEVWLASRADGLFERRVAIKLVRAGLGADSLLVRFQQERTLLARLNHPNIARLLDGGVSSEGRPYLVMEYVDGEPILEFCEGRRLGPRARIELVRRLCGAVEYAHRNLIVHRDIKPGNVLVTADGSPKLLDFGVAKLLESDASSTATALPPLTPRYASPEQLRGDPVTTATDVYSLGVLLFELLTGRLPFEIHAANGETRLAGRTSDRVPRGDLDPVLARALEKEPGARYGSVGQFAADLENFLAGRPVVARSPTVRYRFGKYFRRHWPGIAAATVVFVALALAAVLSIRAAQLARVEQARGARVTRFMEEMLGSADPGWEGTGLPGGDSGRVPDLLPAARERIATVFADDPAAQARLHGVIARAYTNMERYPEAEAEMRAALALLPALHDDPAQQARLLFAAGDLDFRLSHSREQERELREAVRIFESAPALAADASEHALYLTKLAEILADVGKKREATEYADRAARLAASVAAPSPVPAGIVHENLALVYLKLGRLEPARTEARRAVAQLARSPRPLTELGQMYMWLAIVERCLGDLSAARADAEESAAAAIRASGSENATTIGPRIERAFMRALEGDFPRALPELARCLAQARAGSSDEDLFHALHSLGYVLTLAGRPREGEPLLREATNRGAAFLSKTGPSMGIASLEFGECLERLGRPGEARPLYLAAYNNLNAYYGDVDITRQAQAKLAGLGHP
jgi:serine/threonine-protein kinase